MYQKKAEKSNESNIFKYIFEKRDTFVINEIAENLNISFPTVKKFITSLLEKNIITETKKVGVGVGRKAMEYKFNENCCYSVGVLVSAKKIRFILINAGGKILKKYTHLLKTCDSKNEILYSTKQFVCDIDPKIKSKLVGIGISVPGIVSKEGNFIEFSSRDKIPISFNDDLKNIFNIPVLIENESNLAAIAEAFLTKNYRYSDFTVLTINDYIGISNFHREDLADHFFFKAGRLHHMVIESNGKLCECGGHGCWGAYISNIALLNDFKKYFPDIKKFSDIFKPEYCESNIGKIILDDYIKYLSIGIKNVLFFSNPEKLIISGELCLYKDYIIDKLAEKIYKNHIFYRGKETIAFSTLEEKGSIIGAAMFPIIDKIF